MNQQAKAPEERSQQLAKGELTEAELATVNGGIIAILIGRSGSNAPPAK